MTAHGISESNTAPSDPRARTPAGRVWRAGLLAAAVAAVANAIVFTIERMALGLSLPVPQGAGAEMAPLSVVMVVVVSVVVGIGATLLLAILNRFVRRPIRIFQGIAAVALLLSFGGPLSLPADIATKVGLSTMHLVAAAAIVGLLTGMSRVPKEAL
jgi:Family of unknown function (DUF6069)